MSASLATDRVPVAPLREAFEASDLTLSQVCRRLGWYAGGKPDTSRLKRALGTLPLYSGGHAGCRRYYAHRIGYERAVRIIEAIGADPVDVDL